MPLYDAIWQAFAVLLPVKSVGVMGDGRTYDHVCALRAVTSTNGMTADYFPIPHDYLGWVATRLINEVCAAPTASSMTSPTSPPAPSSGSEGGFRSYPKTNSNPDFPQSQRLAAREGRFDYLLVGSTGVSEPLPAAEPRLGRRTARTFPLLPPPQKN